MNKHIKFKALPRETHIHEAIFISAIIEQFLIFLVGKIRRERHWTILIFGYNFGSFYFSFIDFSSYSSKYFVMKF